MEERRIVEESHGSGQPRSRGPIIGLLIVMAIVLVALVVYLASGDSDDGDDGVEIDDIEVDVGE